MIKRLSYYWGKIRTSIRYGIPLYKQQPTNWLDKLLFRRAMAMEERLLFSDDNQELFALSLLRKHFGHAFPKRIVDIGANHPTQLNNTYVFEKLFGSEVYSFEPNRGLKAYWEAERPGSPIQFNGISEEKAVLRLHVPVSRPQMAVQDHVYASFNTEKAKLEHYGITETEYLEVEVGPPHDFLSPGHYELLFIDTEGHEMQVLKGIDFSRFSFDLIVLENNYSTGGDEAIRKYLQQAGYRLALRSYRLDDYYLRVARP